MPACVYCGADAGAYDEHEACVEASCATALEGAFCASDSFPGRKARADGSEPEIDPMGASEDVGKTVTTFKLRDDLDRETFGGSTVLADGSHYDLAAALDSGGKITTDDPDVTAALIGHPAVEVESAKVVDDEPRKKTKRSSPSASSGEEA